MSTKNPTPSNSRNSNVSKNTPIKSVWNFSSLYKSINDPKIESDVAVIESLYATFSKKYAQKSEYIENETALYKALKDWEELNEITSSWKPVWYLHLLADIDSDNSKISTKKDLLESRLIKAVNQIIFFEIKLGKISVDLQNQFLKSEKLNEFRYYLEQIFITAKHNLSEPEEKILNLLSQTSRGMWIDAQKKFLYSHTVKHKGKQIPLSQALEIKADLPIKERYALHAEITKKCKEISFFAEAELNAVVTDKKVRDELRNFKTPYESTILGYQNNQKSIEALVGTVTKNFSISQRFYKIKAKFMNLPQLSLADIGVDIGSTKKKFTLEDGITLVSNSFSKAGEEFSVLLMTMINQGHIDFYPRKGKRSGAYCSGGSNIPTSILMNYTDSMNSVMTLAHEMGHAIHTESSKVQPQFYQDYTISVAEVASTFFENLVFEEVFSTLPEKEKAYALFNRIQDDVSTIFRQIGFFNFELDLHTQIRERGGLSKEEIAGLYKKNIGNYLGKAVKMTEEDGYSYIYVPHFRSFFYVYSYAYGQLISKALYKKYKENPQFIDKIKEFLSAGGSKSPDAIFKDIGIDTTKPEFFEQGLKSIEEDIITLEKLAKKNKLI